MLLIPWIAAIALAIADEIVVSKLLRIQYVNFRSAWERDGKPRGIFWIPEEAKIGRWYITYASGHAGQLARWRWLFSYPDWAAEVEEAGLLILLHRIFLPGFMIGLITPFVIAAFTQSLF